ncbi:hypothetical protein D1AOALGA4SA_10302 [Olavius algarvensis Delta 1 endosymbiont]|nr:hypothetical protein D1AOALGA4SA_10302 [Olavius algarvensis Delta 1 endosymbiont]
MKNFQLHKIPIFKHQNPNKSQIPIINDPNRAYERSISHVWDLEFWLLGFV